MSGRIWMIFPEGTVEGEKKGKEEADGIKKWRYKETKNEHEAGTIGDKWHLGTGIVKEQDNNHDDFLFIS